MKTLLSRVEEEAINYSTAEEAVIDHLKMSHAHLFEETEGRDEVTQESATIAYCDECGQRYNHKVGENILTFI